MHLYAQVWPEFSTVGKNKLGVWKNQQYDRCQDTNISGPPFPYPIYIFVFKVIFLEPQLWLGVRRPASALDKSEDKKEIHRKSLGYKQQHLFFL